jgi:heat shock protein HslJ
MGVRLGLRVSGIVATAVLAQPTVAAEFQARGNEPGWVATVTDKAIELRTMDGKVIVVSPKPEARLSETFAAKIDGQDFALVINDRVCRDSMSGMPFPKTVAISLGEWRQTGCGGAPVDLLLGDWIINSVDGEAGSADAKPTLNFDADGKLAGGGVCNRFFGGFTLTGEGLSIGDVGSTQMACEDALMAQERQLLDALRKIERFDTNTRDRLRLLGQDTTIELSRK